MASSNDIEVLDPTATVEKLKNIVSKVALNRRHFMAALGAAGIAAGTRLGSGPVARAQQPTPNGFAQIDVINFLLNIKYLKATFYSYVTTGADLPGSSYVTLASGQVYNAPGKISFSGTNAAQIADMFNEMYYDELNQLIDLRNLLGVASVPRTTMNLLGNSVANATYVTPSGTVISTGAQAIGQARMLEDISVTAFAGALSYLTGPSLAIATQILAVDGCHAAALRLASIQTGAAYQGTLYQSSFQIGTNGTNIVTAILASTAAVVGDIITAPGLIPAGAVITAITPAANKTPTGVVINTSKVITGVNSIAGLAVGQPITGTGIPANTYIAAPAPSGTTINISNAVTATPTAITPTGYITAGSTSITGVSSISGLAVGQPITSSTTAVVGQVLGVIPAGTTITAASGTTITMSQAAAATGSVTITGIVTNGSTTLTPVSSTTGLATGQVITGAGIPSGTKISTIGTTVTLSAKATATSAFPTTTSFNGIVNATMPTSLTAPTSSNDPAVITQVTSAAGVPGTAGLGLAVGQPLTAPGINPGATITAIGANTVTMSQPATASSVVTPTGTVTAGSNVITNVTNVTGVVVGQVIAGPTISFTAITTNASASLTSVSNTFSFTAITTSGSASLTSVASTFSFTAITTSGSASLTSVSSLTGLAVGQVLTGAGIPASTTIIALSGTTITMSAKATATVSTAETITSSTSLAVGQILTGAGIPANTAISAISGTTITMSANATATVSTAVTITSSASLAVGQVISAPVSFTGITTSGSPTLTGVSSVTGLAAGQGLTGTGIPANTVISSIVTTAPFSITMSANANYTITTAEPITSTGPHPAQYNHQFDQRHHNHDVGGRQRHYQLCNDRRQLRPRPIQRDHHERRRHGALLDYDVGARQRYPSTDRNLRGHHRRQQHDHECVGGGGIRHGEPHRVCGRTAPYRSRHSHGCDHHVVGHRVPLLDYDVSERHRHPSTSHIYRRHHQRQPHPHGCIERHRVGGRAGPDWNRHPCQLSDLGDKQHGALHNHDGVGDYWSGGKRHPHRNRAIDHHHVRDHKLPRGIDPHLPLPGAHHQWRRGH